MARRTDDRVEVGVTYWPSAVGPYMWHEFDEAAVRHDLTAIAARRFDVVRLLLSWDAFMPMDRGPSPHRMRDLETVLGMARELHLRVLPTLFAQSIGDCVLLPPYAIDRRNPRRGVRCVTDGRAVAGGPRDIYADPLMLEVQVRWLDALLAAFSAHPAVAGWDLGYDPATTIRPRRIVEMAAWAELLAGRIRAQGETCRLSVGQADVTGGRGVRLATLAAHVDELGLVVRPQRLALPGSPLTASRVQFTLALAQSLAGGTVPLMVDIGWASGEAADAHDSARDLVTSPPLDVRRAADEALQRLLDAGVAGLGATGWSDWGPRLAVAPPGDRRPWWSRLGIVDATGVSKPVAEAWDAVCAREHARGAPSPYPAAVDVESYYANLPDSLLDLHASWEDSESDTPAILD